MAGPWEQYAPSEGPWTQYKEPPPVTANPNLRAQGLNMENAREFISQRDPGIDYSTGINHAAFRAGFSRMSNEDEKANYLDKVFGKDQWGKDSFGAYFVKPQGAKRLGINAVKPLSIDEQTVTRYDVADWAGDAPAIAGAVGGGMAATGLGVLPGMAMSALGAAGGKAIDEVVKNVQGLQMQTPGQVASGIATEGALAGAGELGGRALMGLGKFALGPAASRMTPEKKALADAAIDQGFKIRPGALTEAPILGRWEGMVKQIFGDLYEAPNRAAAQQGLNKLSQAAGPQVSREAAGEAVADSVRKARVLFGQDMGRLYGQVDQLAQGQPIVPTAPIKAVAQELLEAMPKTADGKAVGGKTGFINDILQMGDAMTVTNAQRLRTMLREMSESDNLAPDISMHDARMLRNSVNDAFAAAKQGNSPAINALKSADAQYAQGIRRFDNQVVTNITRDAGKPGAVDADMVVDYLVKPERIVRLRRVKEVVAPDVWDKVKASHAQELLGKVVKGTDDPLKAIFSGRALRDSLDDYGRATLEEVHGKQWVDDAYRYATSLMLAEKRMQFWSGNLVAANIAIHPIQNLPRLIWIRALAKVMQHPATFKYLTEGFKPNATVKETTAAATRLASQITALANDETGSASVTLTPPQ